MHSGELWQEYTPAGVPLKNGGRPAGHSEAAEARPGLYSVACVWLYRKKSGKTELLFQKRSQYVDRNAGKWDVSAGGHIDYGEDVLSAAVREAKEEIGAAIKAEDLEFLYAVRDKKCLRNIFVCPYNADDFVFNDQEVEEVKWVSFAELKEFWQEYTKEPLAKDKIQLKLLRKRFDNGDIDK